MIMFYYPVEYIVSEKTKKKQQHELGLHLQFKQFRTIHRLVFYNIIIKILKIIRFAILQEKV